MQVYCIFFFHVGKRVGSNPIKQKPLLSVNKLKQEQNMESVKGCAKSMSIGVRFNQPIN